MSVVLLLALIWAAVLVPPALRSRAARKEAFVLSFGAIPAPVVHPPPSPRSTCVQRRRRIAGGLLVAMAATLLVGLLPTFRVLLVVHLFLLDSFLGYIAVLAHTANRSANVRAPRPAVATPTRVELADPGARRRRRMPRPGLLGDLGPIAG